MAAKKTSAQKSEKAFTGVAKQTARWRTLHYKRAEIIGAQDDSRTLQELLVDALGKHAKVTKRIEKMGEDGVSMRVINKPYRHGDFVAGMMLAYTEGDFQPTIKLDDEALELQIGLMAPNEREQFIAHTLFFGVYGHHLILIQSPGLKSGAFEQHVNWLLRELTKVMPHGATLSIRDEPPRKVREELKGVKSVTLSAPFTLSASGPDGARLVQTGSPTSSEQNPKRLSVIGAAAKVVFDALRLEGTFLESLSADDVLRLEDVEINVEIRRVGRAPEGQSLVDELAQVLRHVDDDVFEMKTRSGRVLRSGELKLQMSKQVQTLGGMPILKDVAERMQDWLAELIGDKQVSVT